MQGAAGAAGEAGPVEEDAGALVHAGLAVAVVVGLDPALRRAGLAVLPVLVGELVDPRAATRFSSSVVGEVRAERAAAVVGPVRRRCPGSRGRRCRSSSRSARSGRSGTPAASSAGSRNSTQARGKTRSTSGTRASVATVHQGDRARWTSGGCRYRGQCDLASSTSARTPATCWWSTRTVVPRRCRRTPSRSRCASPSTSTTTVRSPSAGIEALIDFVAAALRGRRGQGLRGDARLRHLRGPRRHQLRRRARARPRRRRRSTSRCCPVRTRRG